MTSINRNFVNNINKLSLSEDRRIVRKIEKLSYRLNIARNAVIFINKYIYVYIYIYIYRERERERERECTIYD